MCWPWVNGKRRRGFASPAVVGTPNHGVPAWVTPGILQTPWVPRAAFTLPLQGRDLPMAWLLLVPARGGRNGQQKTQRRGQKCRGLWGCPGTGRSGRERAAPREGLWGEDGLRWDWVNPACFAECFPECSCPWAVASSESQAAGRAPGGQRARPLSTTGALAHGDEHVAAGARGGCQCCVSSAACSLAPVPCPTSCRKRSYAEML